MIDGQLEAFENRVAKNVARHLSLRQGQNVLSKITQ